jgi:hypothetical protein
MSVRTLVVQPASAGVLHCYAAGTHFDSRVTARVLAADGVRGGQLVTTGRPPDRWCLVLQPVLPVEQGNAQQLERLVRTWAGLLGLNQIRLLRPVERREGGPATDIYDWLKW